MPSEFCLGSRNLAVAERFSHGKSPVDWPGFALDPETVPWHRRPQVSQEHASLEVQRVVDVQPGQASTLKTRHVPWQPQPQWKIEQHLVWFIVVRCGKSQWLLPHMHPNREGAHDAQRLIMKSVTCRTLDTGERSQTEHTYRDLSMGACSL